MKSPAVVLINPKYTHNVAAAIRACSCFGIKSLLWTGDRVNPENYDRLPREERMKGYQEVEWRRSAKPLNELMGIPVCIEIHPGSISLSSFQHPTNAIYVFGPEDGGVPSVYRRFCHHFIHIPAFHCLNLAAALNVVLYDRTTKLGPPENYLGTFSVADYENRGEIPVPGWDGK